MTHRPLKKSESLEIRIPHPTKTAFMARCREEGLSASDVLRGFIEMRIGQTRRQGRTRHAIILGAIVAAVLGGVAAPSLAATGASRQFEAIDADGNHMIDQGEFVRLDRDHDGRISLGEFRAAGEGSGRRAD